MFLNKIIFLSLKFQEINFFEYMKRFLPLISGLLFLLFSALLIGSMKFKQPMLASTQFVSPKAPFAMENIVSGFLYVQEITVKKKYINGFELQFATMVRKHTNDDLFLLINQENRVLYREKFSSADIEAKRDPNGYFRFNPGQPIYVGTGNIIYLCICSDNGDRENNVTPWCDQTGTIGKLYVSRLQNNDIITSIGNKVKLYPGSFILKTYESDDSGSIFYKICFSLLAVFVSFCIVFIRRIKTVIIRSNLKPEKIFLLLACIFGIFFVFITPPLQVPDETTHMYSSYRLSEFHLRSENNTVPESLTKLHSVFSRLEFKTDEKTSVHEILSNADTKLDPKKRTAVNTYEPIIPYIPQAFAMLIGRLLNFSPLFLLYSGRIFNLFISILIIYFAIKITPVLKWAFLLVGLMPKTLFQLASLSYDAITISLSFFLVAVILRYALDKEKKIGFRDIIILFLVFLAVAECKIPYFVLGFMVFLIPRKKISSVKKYLLTFIGLLLLVFIIAQLNTVPYQLFRTSSSSGTAVAIHEQVSRDSLKNTLNPNGQIHFILKNTGQYAGILLKTLLISQRSNLLNNVFGDLGWLDTPLPDLLRNIYLITLIIAALGFYATDIRISPLNKLISFVIILTGISLIATAMYVCCTNIGNGMIYGIQGRYLIPFIPLFCLLFYNQSVSDRLNLAFSIRKNELAKVKKNERSNLLNKIRRDDQVFNKFLASFLILICVITLIWTMIILVTRYYQF